MKLPPHGSSQAPKWRPVVRAADIAGTIGALFLAVMIGCGRPAGPGDPAGRDFPNLFGDGDFEGRSPLSADGAWKFELGSHFLWAPISPDSRAHALVAAASMIAPSASARFSRSLTGLKPGGSYLFEGWLLKDKNIDGVYPSISLFGKAARLSDFWTAGKWRKSTLIFAAPRAIVSAPTLEVSVPAGDYTLWLDDLSLREIGAKLARPPDKATIRKGLIRFSWKQTPTDRLLETALVLSRESGFKGPGGRRVLFENFAPAGADDAAGSRDPQKRSYDRAGVEFPNDLDPGEWFWRVEISQYRTVLAVSETRRFFNRGGPARAKPSVLRASREQDLARNDRSVSGLDLPIGMFKARVADFSELAALGFNAVSISGLGTAAEIGRALVEASRNGLRVLAPPAAAASLDPAAEESGSILAWYLEDEPEGRGIAPISVRSAALDLVERGFTQPGLIVLNRSWRANDYAPTAPILMADPYPVPYEPLSWLGECLDEIGSAVKGDPSKSVWAAIQAFGWSDGAADGLETRSGRAPIAAEVKALTRLALIHGARGIFYYAYRSGPFLMKDREELWRGVRESVSEIRSFLPIFLAPPSQRRIGIQCEERDSAGIPAVHAAVRELKESIGPHRAGLYLLCVNTLARAVSAEVVIDGLGARKIALNGLEGRVAFVGEK